MIKYHSIDNMMIM